MHSPSRQRSASRLDNHAPLVSLGVPLVPRLVQLEIARRGGLRLCAADQNLVNGNVDWRELNVSTEISDNGLVKLCLSSAAHTQLDKVPNGSLFSMSVILTGWQIEPQEVRDRHANIP